VAAPIFVLDIDPAGIVATHPRRLELPLLVAPIPEEQKADDLNTIRAHLVAIGCLRFFKDGFAFDSSVVGPEAERSFTSFAKLMRALREQDDAEPKRFPPCSVFGHTDPTGDDPYNKTLSGRRALAVYAVLVRDVQIWEQLFSGFVGDQWGVKSIQTMLSVSLKKGPGVPAEPPFYTGPIDGKKTKETNGAVAAYLDSRGLTGVRTLDLPGDVKRRARLFAEYMDALCHDPAGERFVLDPESDFIARRQDKNLKGDVQGCGEFNPIFLLSKEDEDSFKKDPLLAKAVRDPLYVVNRRVVVYVFRHGTQVDPRTWPCPHAREDHAKCKLRFWSDHSKRRNPGPVRREFGENMAVLRVDETGALTERPVEESGNTMGCRFYHAFAVHSPCETKLKEWVVRFKVDTVDGRQEPLDNRRYVAQLGDAEFAAVTRGTTNAQGELRLPVLDEQTRMNLKLDVFGRPATLDDDSRREPGPPPADGPPPAAAAEPGFDTDRFSDEDRFLPFVLDAGSLRPRDADDDLAIKQRLYNLGFGERAPTDWSPTEFANAFTQYRHRRGLDNADDGAVRAKILSEHDLEDATPPDEDSQTPTT
jgi:hypothetical protein